ncbi:MAG TPA: hypothetical protein VGI98_00985 [Candidatus Limnocylindrales bacterium]
MTRRPVALALAIALIAGACGAVTTNPSGPRPSPSLAATAIAAHAVPAGATAAIDDATWALAERVTAPTYTSDATNAFKAALAAAGIAVVADASSDPAVAVPEVPLTGTTSPVELLDFQAHDLAVQTWGGSTWTGAELDGVAPLPADAPPGTPSLAQLLAAYAASAATPGGAFARALLAGQDLKNPPTLRFPAVVLFLFSSDLATDGGRIPAPGRSPSAAVRLLPLAAAGPIAAAPAVDLGLACSGPSGWIDAAVQDLEAALVSAMPSGIVGTVLGAALSWFLHVAAGVVKGLVDTFLAPVLTLIRGIAAIASGLAEQIASVMPFTVQVIAGHGDTTAGATFFLGSDPERGQYTAYVSAGDLPSWPDAVSTCAAAAGISLPDFTSKGVPVTFGPLDAPADPLLGPTDQAATTTATDETGKAVWPFLTARDPGDPTGEQRNQFDYMPVAVHRPELDTLKRRLTLTLLSPLPAILQPFVGALLAPVLNGIQDRLNTVLDVRGMGPAIIVYHDKAAPTPAPSPSATPSGSSACAVSPRPGTYAGTFEAQVDSPQPPVRDQYAVSGPVSLQIAVGGAVTGSFSAQVTHIYDLSGDIPEHMVSTWDMQAGRLQGSVCQLGLVRGVLGPITCQDSRLGDCSGPAPGAFAGPDITVPTSSFGAPTGSASQLRWLLSYDGQTPGLIEHWSIVVNATQP